MILCTDQKIQFGTRLGTISFTKKFGHGTGYGMFFHHISVFGLLAFASGAFAQDVDGAAIVSATVDGMPAGTVNGGSFSLVIDEAWIETLRDQMPELPAQRLSRYMTDYGLPSADARVLTASRELSR